MNSFVTFILLFVLSCQFVIALKTIKTSPMSDTTNFTYMRYGGAAVGGPYAISAGVYKNSSDWALNIQKRNASGYYAQIAQFQPFPESVSVATNGKWFAASSLRDRSSVVFQLTDDKTISNVFNISHPDGMVRLLSDDSLLLITEEDVTTYTYMNDGRWSILDVTTFQNKYIQSPLGLIHVTDNTIAYVSKDRTACLYTRQNKSWQLKYSILLSNTSSIYNIAWNGDDTFIACGTHIVNFVGNISIYQLTGNSWNFVKNIYGFLDLGIKLNGYLGLAMTLLDKDRFIVSAPLDGATTEYNGGSAFIIQRKSGSWFATARLEPSTLCLYAVTIGYNDMDILLYSCTPLNMDDIDCRQHVIQRCFDSPIDVTCKDVKLDSCNVLSAIDYSTLYTINNPHCGTVDVDVQTLNVDSKTIKFSLEFSRSFTEPVSCDAQVTCSGTIGAGQQLVNVALFLSLVVLLI